MGFMRKLFGQKQTKDTELSRALEHGIIYRTCLNCLHQYPDGAMECESCGAKLEVIDKETRHQRQLIMALKHSDSRVREQAAIALGKLGDGRPVKPLIAALKDPDSKVRGQALRALEQLDAHLNDWQRIEVAMTTRQPELIVKLGSAGVEPLIAALKDSDCYVREQAAIALGRIEDVRAVEPLIGALRRSDIRVREQAAIALGRIGDVRAVDPLITLLKSTYSGVREQAAIALGKIGDPRAVDPLTAVLQHTDSRVREQAAIALGKLGDARAVGPLFVALKDSDSQVRGRAMKAVRQLDRYTDDWQRVELAMTTKRPELVVDVGTAAVEPLIVALSDPDWDETAARALGMIGDARAVEPLIAALKGSSAATREQAAIALGVIGDQRAVPPLIDAVRDSERAVRKQATLSLDKIDSVRAVRLLIDRLQVQDSRTAQNWVAEALTALGHDVLPLKWPALVRQIGGNSMIQVDNPNNFQVRVGLRSGNSGRDFVIPPFESGFVGVPPGSYEVFFQYQNDPLTLFQGGDIRLESTLNHATIQIVRSPDGNYNIRPV